MHGSRSLVSAGGLALMLLAVGVAMVPGAGAADVLLLHMLGLISARMLRSVSVVMAALLMGAACCVVAFICSTSDLSASMVARYGSMMFVTLLVTALAMA